MFSKFFFEKSIFRFSQNAQNPGSEDRDFRWRSMIFVISRKSIFRIFWGVWPNFRKKISRVLIFTTKRFFQNFFSTPQKKFFFQISAKFENPRNGRLGELRGAKIHDFAHFGTWKCCISPFSRPIWHFLPSNLITFATRSRLKPSELKSEAIFEKITILVTFSIFLGFRGRRVMSLSRGSKWAPGGRKFWKFSRNSIKWVYQPY